MGDGKLDTLNKAHDKIGAGEMEGYGFAVGCELHRPPIPWLVIRGISDYGDATKDGKPRSGEVQTSAIPEKDEYHLAAAASAACFLRKFLEKNYTPATRGVSHDSGMTGTLSDRQIIAMAGNGLLISEEFSLENVEQACYELRVGDTYYELGGGKKRLSTASHGNVLIKPRQLTVVITKESLNIPDDIVGRILTKGRLFSVGILPVNTYADPGFQGKLGIVLYNATPNYLQIRSGEPIAKIEFSRLSERVACPYTGQHGYQTEIWPIPEDVVLSNEEASADSRVGPREVEFERSYGTEIACMAERAIRAERISWAALFVGMMSALIVLLLLIVRK